jgi:hypothetical protein
MEAQEAAKIVAQETKAAIINDTYRGQFLETKSVETAIKDRAKYIFESQGLDQTLARQSTDNFLYGDAQAPPDSPLSIHNCLWYKRKLARARIISAR